MMDKEKIIEILEDYEFFVDDDFGGHYEHINCSQRALTPLGIVNILDYIENLQQENKQLKEQLLVAQTNEETFRLEMKDITQTLGLDEDTLFDDVKAYARSLKNNWNKLREYIISTRYEYGDLDQDLEDYDLEIEDVLNKMTELEQGDLIEK